MSKGPKAVVLEAREMSAGMAFIVNKSITTLFVPFGNADQVGVLGRVMTEGAAARPSNG